MNVMLIVAILLTVFLVVIYVASGIFFQNAGVVVSPATSFWFAMLGGAMAGIWSLV